MVSLGLLRLLFSRAPLILKRVILRGLGMSSVAGKQDMRTELTVAIIRSFMTFNLGVGTAQKKSIRDPGVKGPIWISNITLPRPEDDVREAVLKAIEDLKTDDETYSIPDVVPVEAEWTGYRSGVDKDAPLPDISEEEKYRELRKDAPADMVVLYLHGGAYFLMDPCTHRIPVSHLSKKTGAPVLSVRYRLAPQNPFPAALIDALVAYLSLISPPPGSFHQPVSADKIIIAGDSAGGNLSLALLQTILRLRRVSPMVLFYGQEIPIELPAGIAAISPWCDLTRSMPSHFNNAQYDYLDPPTAPPVTEFHPMPFPPDDVWPANPPRVDLFINASTTLHPLVSPLAARKELWKDAPPIFISLGEEALADEDLIIARKMYQAGAPVVVEQFEGMPHCHGLMMINTPAGRRFFKGLTGFCRDAVAGRVGSTGNLIRLGPMMQSVQEVPLDSLDLLSDEEVDERLRESQRWRVEAERQLLSEWKERARL